MKRLLSFMLCICMVALCAPVTSAAAVKSGMCGRHVFWSFHTDTGELLISGDGEMYDYTEYSHAPWYSYQNDVVSVKINYGVTAVGDYAFYRCTLLKSVELPHCLATVGDSAFRECTELEEIKIPSTVTVIGDFAFAYCHYLAKVSLPKNLEKVGECAFTTPEHGGKITFCCGGTEEDWGGVEIADNNEALLDGRFYYNTEPEMTGICGDGVFWSYDEETGTLTVYGSGKMYDYSVPAAYSPWISFKKSIYNVVIEDGVTYIGGDAFSHCTMLTDLKIAPSVEEIAMRAFCDCTSLPELTIPKGVVTIGNGAFYDCDRIESLEIPDGVEEISYGAFWCCDSLRTVSLPDTLLRLGYDAFSVCPKLEYNKYGGLWYLGSEDSPFLVLAGSSDGYMTTCEIHPDVKLISGDAFYGRTRLAEIEIPDGVRYIGGYSFFDCSSLQIVRLPAGVREIDTCAFWGCTAMTEIYIPGSVTKIARSAFKNCDSLSDVYFDGPESDWNNIEIENEYDFNGCLLGANIHFLRSEHAHSWSEFPEIIPATYTEDGSVSYECTVCGEVKTESLPRLISEIKGDADGDGEMNLKDLLLVRKALAGVDEIDGVYFANADVNGDGDLNMKDTLALRRKIASGS